MKTEQITLILAIVRERSVSKAAETLFISQPTASTMLKSLEKELGYDLFIRTKTGLILTDEGGEFIEYAKAIERSLKSISQIRQPVKRIDFKVLSLKYDFSEAAFEKLCDKYLTNDYAVSFAFQNVSSIEDEQRMIENGSGDIAVTMCRKSLYESTIRGIAKKHLETAQIGDYHLELSCNKNHPIIQNGVIAYPLIGSYPLFTSIPSSGAEPFAPQFLMKYGVVLRNGIVMDPCDTRYRLLKKSNGYLISTPVPESIKESYGFDSLPIEDSDISIFAVYRKDPLKESLIREYIKYCKLSFR